MFASFFRQKSRRPSETTPLLAAIQRYRRRQNGQDSEDDEEDDEDEGDDEDEFKMTSFVDLTQAPPTIDLTQGPQTIDLTGDSTKTFTKEEKGKGKEMPRAGAAPSTKRKRLASTEQDVADHNDTANGAHTTKSLT